MTQVDLRIEKDLDGDSLDNGAMVQIRQVLSPDSSKLVDRIPAPVGDDKSRVKSVELEPGLYEFSAMLPSGSVTSRLVDVKESQAPVGVTLPTDDSAHEWLSWQQWSGNASSRQSVQGLQAQLATGSAVLRESLDQIQAALWWVPASPAKVDPLCERLAAALATLESGDSIDPAAIQPAVAQVTPISLLRDPPYLAARLPKEGRDFRGRAYLMVSNGKRSMLCAMPWPWAQTDRSGQALVEAVIAIDEERIERVDQETTAAADEAWSVRPAVRDRVMGGLICYFAAGEQAAARELLAPARDLLFDKAMNPLAAAAGAHILVGEWIQDSAVGNKLTNWQDWVRNLRNWFPWLPDGALLDGWLSLRRRDREPNVEEARVALLEAERRGIPLYTIGVRRLVDGLLLVSGEQQHRGKKDTEVAAALGRARRLAWQVDPRQAFTCIRLWST